MLSGWRDILQDRDDADAVLAHIWVDVGLAGAEVEQAKVAGVDECRSAICAARLELLGGGRLVALTAIAVAFAVAGVQALVLAATVKDLAADAADAARAALANGRHMEDM